MHDKVAYLREWRKTHREYVNLQAKKYRKPYSENKERNRMSNWYGRIKSNFGWDKGKVDATLEEQGYVCAICKQTNNLEYNFALDHDHKTGLPREFLCHRCNSTLGYINDDQTLLIAMWVYLEKHKVELTGRSEVE